MPRTNNGVNICPIACRRLCAGMQRGDWKDGSKDQYDVQPKLPNQIVTSDGSGIRSRAESAELYSMACSLTREKPAGDGMALGCVFRSIYRHDPIPSFTTFQETQRGTSSGGNQMNSQPKPVRPSAMSRDNQGAAVAVILTREVGQRNPCPFVPSPSPVGSGATGMVLATTTRLAAGPALSIYIGQLMTPNYPGLLPVRPTRYRLLNKVKHG
jgi:hypothetical protein